MPLVQPALTQHPEHYTQKINTKITGKPQNKNVWVLTAKVKYSSDGPGIIRIYLNHQIAFVWGAVIHFALSLQGATTLWNKIRK